MCLTGSAAKTIFAALTALAAGFAFSLLFGSALSGAVRGIAALVLWVAFFVALADATPRRGALLAFFFGLGWFAWGLRWCARSMIEHGHIPFVIAAFGVVLLGALCALFLTVAVGGSLRITQRKAHRAAAPARALVLASGVVLAEWLRGSGWIDFGWLTPAYALLDTFWVGWAPVQGSVGVGAAFLFTAGALAAALLAFRLRRPIAGIGYVLCAATLSAGGGAFAIVSWSTPEAPIAYRILQPDLPVVDLFTRSDPVERIGRLQELLHKDSPARGIVLTPEGVLPAAWERLPSSARAAWDAFILDADAPVLYTNFRRMPQGWANSAFWKTTDGGLVVNDKRKLVPFGEFVPTGFRWFVDLLGIPMADLTAGAEDQTAFEADGNRYAALICYENLEGDVLRRVSAHHVPDAVFVVSNLGWFDRSVLRQHLDMSRMRALEISRPVLSVNMNGNSAVIGADGDIKAMLPDHGAATLSGEIAGASGGATPWVRLGPAPVLILVLLSGLAACREARREVRGL